jgi:glutamine amidotransferase
MISILRYGSGNILAITNIFNRANIAYSIVSSPAELSRATKLILPGVGAFDQVMTQLNQSGLREPLEQLVVGAGIPVLGICVGMQILAEGSDEGSLAGLGWVKGRVRRFDSSGNRLLPHMGWNDVTVTRQTPLFSQLETDARFYFLHSYYFDCANQESSIAESDYGDRFTCGVRTGNVYGVQFHPEKSHRFGVQLLTNFAAL